MNGLTEDEARDALEVQSVAKELKETLNRLQLRPEIAGVALIQVAVDVMVTSEGCTPEQAYESVAAVCLAAIE